ncbi:MAG TPA: glycosyltransferase family 2 protein [Thermoanaerobaculia bacterium]|nr:glycosyltransferase family 2 protein [Thermoanaerobaculia bacterium]
MPVLELAIVVPTYNERQNAIELLARLERVLAGIAYEVIFVDDDSPDGTAGAVREVARRDPRVRVLQRVGRRGLSSACIEGMMATAAPYVAVIDADLQHDETLLPAMLAKLKSGNLDLVVGTRHAEGGSTAGLHSWRLPLSNLGKKLSRTVTRATLSDPMSGFFMLDRRFLDEVVRSLSGSGFKILLDIVASSRRPIRLAELPYHFRPRVHGDSKLDVLVGLEYLKLLVDKLIGDWIPPRFVLFGLVGGSGVILHLAVLYAAFLGFGLTFFTSQLIATLVGMTSNFFLNNILTWRDHRLRGRAAFAGLLKFYAACAIGAFLNLQVATFARDHGAPWYLAGFAGLVVGSVWNFAVTAATTWKRRRRVRATRSAEARSGA